MVPAPTSAASAMVAIEVPRKPLASKRRRAAVRMVSRLLAESGIGDELSHLRNERSFRPQKPPTTVPASAVLHPARPAPSPRVARNDSCLLDTPPPEGRNTTRSGQRTPARGPARIDERAHP